MEAFLAVNGFAIQPHIRRPAGCQLQAGFLGMVTFNLYVSPGAHIQVSRERYRAVDKVVFAAGIICPGTLIISNGEKALGQRAALDRLLLNA